MKIHQSPGTGDIVAVCDRELLNTTISHEKCTVTITEYFYGNSPVSEAEVRQVLERADNINLIGERAVSVAVDMGILSRSGCILIGTVPHAQIYRT